ncbi:MAG: hypothetical protein IJH78_01250 [Clostridia bacterium]|nr:hypothetical protein [Clostridia bacterium]
MNDEDTGRYSDIIDLPRPVSRRGKRLTMDQRAAQFLPFAALPGYGDVIDRASRDVRPRLELSEDERAAIDRQLRDMLGHQPDERRWSVVYYREDALLRFRGRVKRVLPEQGQLLLESGERVPFDDLMLIEEEPSTGE